MVSCNTLTSKDTGDRRMSWYMLHLVALRETDLSLCPPRWMNITQWAKITLRWSLRALCKPSQSSPKDSREACLWVWDMRQQWWQNRWPPMVTRRTDRPANIACYLSPYRYKQNTRQLEIQRLPGMNTANLGIISKSCKYFAMYFCFLYALVWLFILILKIWGLDRHNFVAWLTYMVESI